MVKCLHCGKEIDCLRHREVVTYCFTEDGKYTELEIEMLNFYCPECGRTIAIDEEEAMDFLYQ